MKYFVQVIARNYLKKLPPQTPDFKVHPVYLQGLAEDEFKDGYAALIGFTRDLYTAIMHYPSDFGMPLIEIPEEKLPNSNCAKSHAAFVSIPRLLLAIGNAGTLGTDMILYLNGGELKKKAKQLQILNTAALLKLLADYGFEITGISKKISNYDEIKIGYPDCRPLTAALKSIAEAHSKIGKIWYKGVEYFYMLTPQLIESETSKIKFEVEDVFHFLNEESRELAEILHAYAASRFYCKVETGFSGGNPHNIRRCTYTGKKTKKIIMVLKTRDDRLTVDLNLENTDEYRDEITEMLDYIHNKIRKSGWPCAKCFKKCISGFVYEMDGTEYNICLEPAFQFYNTTAADLPYIKKLLELEIRREN